MLFKKDLRFPQKKKSQKCSQPSETKTHPFGVYKLKLKSHAAQPPDWLSSKHSLRELSLNDPVFNDILGVIRHFTPSPAMLTKNTQKQT